MSISLFARFDTKYGIHNLNDPFKINSIYDPS